MHALMTTSWLQVYYKMHKFRSVSPAAHYLFGNKQEVRSLVRRYQVWVNTRSWPRFEIYTEAHICG